MADGLHWYVSPEGSPRGMGSLESPWNLETALSHPEAVEPGDWIWVLPGEYCPRGPLQSKLKGTAAKPIVVRGLPGEEPPVIDFVRSRAPFALQIRGRHTWFWGLELTSSSSKRWADAPGAEADPRGVGILCEAEDGAKLIHLRVHDLGTSLFESKPSELEVYGCLFFNAYWDGPDRSHGPGLYVRNPAGAPRKRIENNVVFHHGRQGLQGFGSVPFANVDVVGNTFFNNGIARDGFHRNVMFGNASDEHRDVSFRDNVTYYPENPPAQLFNLFGGDGGCHNLELDGNTFAHLGRGAAKIQRCDGEQIENNRFIGWTELTTFGEEELFRGSDFRDRYPNNEYYGDDQAEPWGMWIFVRPSRYLPDRWDNRGQAHVAALNWDGQENVAVDFTDPEATGLVESGTTLEVRNCQNLDQRQEIDFEGGDWDLPMTVWNPAAPAGRDMSLDPLPDSTPEFGAFLVEWRIGESEPLTGPGWVPDPGAGLRPRRRWARRKKEWSGVVNEQRENDREERLLAWRAASLGKLT